MATRRLKAEDWSPTYQTRISTRVAHEPRDEFVRIPKQADRALRPKPLNIPPRQLQSPPDLKAPPPSRKQSSEYGDALREPEIIDIAPSGAWPRRESPAHRQQRKQSPSITSQYSTRQSEISLGILDYYMRDRTPSLHSPTLLPPPTPKVDPAIEKFDFGLPPTPTPSAATPELPSSDAVPGAERIEQPLIPISPPPSSRPPLPPKGYSLFPVIKQVTPPPRQPVLVEETISLQPITPTTHHPPPDPSYRPRKESISTTIGRTRTDSIPKRTPLRIFSSDSTSSTTTPRSRRQISTSSTLQQIKTSSPPSASRWSDDIIASPPSTAGPRTSFGSLLRRESTAQQGYNYYPDCFFEDDDDEAEPLRRRWRRSPGATTSSGESATYAGGRKGRTPMWRRVLLCGCGG